MQKHKRASIVGAGMAGCLMAILLAKDGYHVDLFDCRQDLRKRTDSRRSINQSLSSKGVAALKKAGLWRYVKAICIAQTGRLIHDDTANSPIYQPYGQKQPAIEWTVNRNQLNRLLLDEVRRYKAIRLYHSHKVIGVDFRRRTLKLQQTQTGQVITHSTPLLIGADGINSAVRVAMEKARLTESVIETMAWGYKNIYIRQTGQEIIPLRRDAFHLWSSKNAAIFGMMNHDHFTATLALPLRGIGSFQRLRTKPALARYLKSQFPDIYRYFDVFADDFLSTRPTVFRTLYTSAWYYDDFAVLIGNAAHAMTIFYGQGINAAFDDCVLLARLLKTYADHPKKAFARFQSARKIHTDTVARLCVERFYDLKDKYKSPYYLAAQNVDAMLEKLLAPYWKSLYTLVVHTDLPYAEALRRYELQRLIARCCGLDIIVALYGLILSLSKKVRPLRSFAEAKEAA